MSTKNIQELRAVRIPESTVIYVPTLVDVDNLHIWDRSFAWRLASCPKNDPIWEQLRHGADEYNTFITELRNTEGFIERFTQNGYSISVDEVTLCYGNTLAHRIKELKRYKFSTDLVYQNGFLFDTGYAPKYRIDPPQIESVCFAVGSADAGYPDETDTGKKLLWDWSDDERDFTFALWALFDELGYLPDDENVEKNYDGYLCYDQHRYVMDQPDPNLSRCFKLLKSMGYLTQYVIVPEQSSPWFYYRASKNGTIGLSVLDQSFTKDALLVEKIRLILSCSEEEVTQKRYFLTNSAGMQELSCIPGTVGGHQRYKIYGRMDCSSANRHIANGKYIRGRVFFANEETAVAAGYRPCAVCMRNAYKKWKETQ